MDQDISQKYRDEMMQYYKTQNKEATEIKSDFPGNLFHDEYGSLRIEVSSGYGANPIEDALVVITSKNADGTRSILSSMLTNSSGETKTAKILSPPASLSENRDNKLPVSSFVDISISRKGYYKVENYNVPVFTGITSIQPVNMIPLPINSPDATLKFNDTESDL